MSKLSKSVLSYEFFKEIMLARRFHLSLLTLLLVLGLLAGCSRDEPTRTATAEPTPVAVEPSPTPQPVDAPPVQAAPETDAGAADAPPPVFRSTPGKWSLAEDNPAANWRVYAAPTTITGIEPTEDAIWATSDAGLLRWDRSTGAVTQFLRPTSPLPSNELNNLLLADGVLYITGRGGVSAFDLDARTWQSYDSEAVGVEIGRFAPMAWADGVLWVAATNRFALLHPDGTWEVIKPDPEQGPWTFVQRILVEEDGVYFVSALPAAQSGVHVVRFDGQNWETVERPELEHMVRPDGAWLQTQGANLLASTDNGASWTPLFENDFHLELHAVDAEGRAYLSAQDRILVVTGDQLTEAYRFTDFGPNLAGVNDLAADEEGRLWIGSTDRGLTMFDGQVWTNWRTDAKDLGTDAVQNVVVDGDTVYLSQYSESTLGGVRMYDAAADEWRTYAPGRSPLTAGRVDGMAVDRNGAVWIPTREGVVDRYQAGAWEHLSVDLPEKYVLIGQDGLFDAAGDYWLATDSLGLWRFDGNRWYTYGIPGVVRALATDPAGRIWIGGDVGLVVRDENTQWRLYSRRELPLASGIVKDVAVDAAGRVWLVTDDALLVFNGESVQSFDPEAVGAREWGDALVVDNSQTVWVATDAGLAQFRGEPAIGPFAGLKLEPAETMDEATMFVDVAEAGP